MVVTRGCVVYFDSTDERSDCNRPKRVIPLSGALVRRQLEDKAGGNRRSSNSPKERFEILLSTRVAVSTVTNDPCPGHLRLKRSDGAIFGPTGVVSPSAAPQLERPKSGWRRYGKRSRSQTRV